jgi:glutathione S-transferase
MILIGRYFSPFVRRVGATLQHYGLPYEHRSIRAAGESQDEIRKFNPLGRVPALVLDDGNVLSDSAVIIEYLDDRVGPGKALTPASGWERFHFLSLVSIANGGGEKAIAAWSEHARPEEKREARTIENCRRQARDAFEHLDSHVEGKWFRGDRFSQLDITVTAHLDFMRIGMPDLIESIAAPKVKALTARALELPCFKQTMPET